MIFPDFTAVRKRIIQDFIDRSYEVKAPKWQGIDISAKPGMEMREILNYSFQLQMRSEDLEYWTRDTGCNQPFADTHFAERVGRQPTNPGEAWKIWPWGNKASDHLEGGVFTHTYQERLWGKYANRKETVFPRMGIRYPYADLDDLVEHLQKDPMSRQAYVPLWFPEDGSCKGRRPCTLGWHFILRNNYFHHTYYIRSCDFIRHFADDCYLAVRLHLWVLEELRKLDSAWKAVKPGLFSMHIVSLHMFRGDYEKLLREK